MAGKITHSKKELDELRQRLEAERAELQVQLTTIEETSFATSQSDISGEVSFEITSNAACLIFSGSVPTKTFVPISIVIGRSVFSRTVMHGTPR